MIVVITALSVELFFFFLFFVSHLGVLYYYAQTQNMEAGLIAAIGFGLHNMAGIMVFIAMCVGMIIMFIGSKGTEHRKRAMLGMIMWLVLPVVIGVVSFIGVVAYEFLGGMLFSVAFVGVVLMAYISTTLYLPISAGMKRSVPLVLVACYTFAFITAFILEFFAFNEHTFVSFIPAELVHIGVMIFLITLYIRFRMKLKKEEEVYPGMPPPMMMPPIK